jgi:hypothetical protein
MSLQNPRLGAPAYARIYFNLSYHWPDGWTVGVVRRREGTDEFEGDTYPSLDVFEAHEIVGEALAHLFGI